MIVKPSTTIYMGLNQRLAASAAHAAVLLPLWGVIVPFAAWVLYKDRSPYVRLQALQALSYQLLVALDWVALGVLYTLMMVVILYMKYGTFVVYPFTPVGPMACGVLIWIAGVVYGLAAAVRVLLAPPVAGSARA
jgi:uncharacterized Tic20 family protein